MKTGLPPILNATTRLLILGSLPGDISLARQEYYASKTNDFWKILSALLYSDLTTLSYQERINLLQEKRIGLWDLFHRAERPGSADNDIVFQELNDFSLLREKSPGIELICFNGKKAGEGASHLIGMGYRCLVLPSTSGANRRDQQGRLRLWQTAIGSVSI